MEKEKYTYRYLVALSLIALHLTAIGYYIHFAASGGTTDNETSTIPTLVKGKYYPSYENTGRIMYCGYGFINSMFGIVAGIVLLLKPHEGYNGFLKVWIISAIIIMLSSFAVQMFLNVSVDGRFTILLLSIIMNGFVLLVAKAHPQKECCENSNTNCKCEHTIEMQVLRNV